MKAQEILRLMGKTAQISYKVQPRYQRFASEHFDMLKFQLQAFTSISNVASQEDCK